MPALKPAKKAAVNKPVATASPARKAAPVFRRAELVGKFPQVKHLAAPKAARRLDVEERRQILASMLLG
jgi:hypothetical protein